MLGWKIRFYKRKSGGVILGMGPLAIDTGLSFGHDTLKDKHVRKYLIDCCKCLPGSFD